MPHVIIKLQSGRSEQQKAKLAEEVIKAVMAGAKCAEHSVSVAIEDIEPQQWIEKVYEPDILGNWDRTYKKPGYNPVLKSARPTGKDDAETAPRDPSLIVKSLGCLLPIHARRCFRHPVSPRQGNEPRLTRAKASVTASAKVYHAARSACAVAAQIAHVLQTGPFPGHLFRFRSRRTDYSETGRCGTVGRISLLHLLP